jgi:hypothetical protein
MPLALTEKMVILAKLIVPLPELAVARKVVLLSASRLGMPKSK